MTNEKKITCIVCPIGCKILTKTDGTHFEVLNGNKCKRGVEYARNEALDPRRMLTTTVLVKNGKWPLVSVKSTKPVPKQKIFEVLKEIKKITLAAPVTSGQVVLENAAGTKIDIVSTKTITKIKK